MFQINTKPDVFIASEGHLVDIDRHYEREHRIYTLMKWILRVYRRDPTRTQPLLMVDAGKILSFLLLYSTGRQHKETPGFISLY